MEFWNLIAPIVQRLLRFFALASLCIFVPLRYIIIYSRQALHTPSCSVIHRHSSVTQTFGYTIIRRIFYHPVSTSREVSNLRKEHFWWRLLMPLTVEFPKDSIHYAQLSITVNFLIGLEGCLHDQALPFRTLSFPSKEQISWCMYKLPSKHTYRFFEKMFLHLPKTQTLTNIGSLPNFLLVVSYNIRVIIEAPCLDSGIVVTSIQEV